jgi:hypothetical protein
MRAQATAESERTLEDMRDRLSSVSSTITSELGSLTDRFASTSEEMRREAARASAEIAAEQARLREQLERLPVAAQESSESAPPLHDQIKALDQLSSSRRAPPSTGRHRPARRALTPAAHVSAGPPGAKQSFADLAFVDHAQELGNRQRQRGAPDNREGWSLGDLLARASRDEDGGASGGGGRQAPFAFNLDLEAIARALDPATASAIWSRLRAGQRGVMVRSIYGSEGRSLFDDVNHRCRSDPDLGRTISRYLADFERIISESDIRDPSGRLTQSQLVSDTGRVYLFLAHACGRLG